MDEKTLLKAIKIAEVLNGSQCCDDVGGVDLIGKHCIVRTYSAGVFAGIIHSKTGKDVVVKNARRLWRWDGAASLSQLAMEGVKKPSECKFPCEVGSVTLTEAIEIIPTTAVARKSIEGVPIWEM